LRPSLRFLALAIFGWVGFRVATLGALPGAEIFRIDTSQAKPPPIMPTQFPPIDPIAAADPQTPFADLHEAALPYGQMPVGMTVARTIVVPVYYSGGSLPPPPLPDRSVNFLPRPREQFYSPLPALDQWPLSRLASAAYSPLRSSPVTPGESIPAALERNSIDRLQLTAWAMLRAQSAGVAGTPSLAGGGQLGASQAGARLTYNFTRQIAASFRTTSEVGRRGGEVAAGMRIQPAAGIPLWVTAERRQRVGRYGGGRNAFAMFFEAGVYDRPMPLDFLLDGYLQGGVVGFRSRDGFVDGALTLTRPVYKQFSAGVGVWGGAQPGVYRVDAGPRVTMRVRKNVRVHFDWRQRLAGNAVPGSGPAVTLASDF
jgi:hypothetical protein